MPRLIPCPSCRSHVRLDELECPHCGTRLRTTFAPRATTILLGLTLAGCPADDTGDGSGGGTAADAGSATATAATSAATGTDSAATTDDPLTGGGGVEYGTPDTGLEDDGTTGTTGTGGATGTETDGPTGTGASTDTGATVGEPEYGVAETTSG